MPYVGKSMDRKRNRRVAQDAIRAASLEVGTVVDLVLDDGTRMRTKTRSEPWQLGSTLGAWVVMVEGKTGGWALERVVPVHAGSVTQSGIESAAECCEAPDLGES